MIKDSHKNKHNKLVKHMNMQMQTRLLGDLEIQSCSEKEEALQNSGECSNQTINPHTVRWQVALCHTSMMAV